MLRHGTLFHSACQVLLPLIVCNYPFKIGRFIVWRSDVLARMCCSYTYQMLQMMIKLPSTYFQFMFTSYLFLQNWPVMISSLNMPYLTIISFSKLLALKCAHQIYVSSSKERNMAFRQQRALFMSLSIECLRRTMSKCFNVHGTT